MVSSGISLIIFDYFLNLEVTGEQLKMSNNAFTANYSNITVALFRFVTCFYTPQVLVILLNPSLLHQHQRFF